VREFRYVEIKIRSDDLPSPGNHFLCFEFCVPGTDFRGGGGVFILHRLRLGIGDIDKKINQRSHRYI
jgi:hypothetical protein